MGFYEHLTEFAGKSVYDYSPEKGVKRSETEIPALRMDWDSQTGAEEFLERLLGDPQAEWLTGIVFGLWTGGVDTYGPPSRLIELLIASADQLPTLKAIFLGDILGEECEVSWIQQTDLSPLWDAFPKLEHLGIRGAEGLSLGKLKHDSLKTLILESGGLSSSVIEQVVQSRLPLLEHLEIYTGDSGYGWGGDIETLRPLLSPELFPKLRYLGVKNCEQADEVASAIADSPLLEQLEVLDLSLGTLGDHGGEALFKAKPTRALKKLDLHHHYLSDEVMEKLNTLPIELNLTEQEYPHDYNDGDGRYVAVGE